MTVKWRFLADQVEAKLAKMAPDGPEKAKALGALGNALANRIRLGFRLGQSPHGKKWAPLNPGFRTGQPLRDTGRLQRSITSQVVGQAALVGTNVRYGAVHQFGATITPKTGKYLAVPRPGGGIFLLKKAVIPARPFMPLSPTGQLDLPKPWAQSALRALAKSMGL